MNVFLRRLSRFAWRRGPGYRTRCRGLPCCRSTRGARNPLRIFGSTRPSPRDGVVWWGPPRSMEPRDACLELARRYLHIFGPATVASFARWAGIGKPEARDTFAEMASTLTPVNTPAGDAWVLADDEAAFRQP